MNFEILLHPFLSLSSPAVETEQRRERQKEENAIQEKLKMNCKKMKEKSPLSFNKLSLLSPRLPVKASKPNHYLFRPTISFSLISYLRSEFHFEPLINHHNDQTAQGDGKIYQVREKRNIRGYCIGLVCLIASGRYQLNRDL